MSPLAMDLPSPRAVVCNDMSFTFPQPLPLGLRSLHIHSDRSYSDPFQRASEPPWSPQLIQIRDNSPLLRMPASLRNMSTSPRIKVYFLIQYLLQNKGFCQVPDQNKAAPTLRLQLLEEKGTVDKAVISSLEAFWLWSPHLTRRKHIKP